MDNQLNQLLKELENSRKTILEHGMKNLKAAGGNFFHTDFVFIGAANRSLALIDGFISLHQSRNFLCMAPMVRMHLDTLLRLHALKMVDSVEKVAAAIFQGEQISKMKGTSKLTLTDRNIRENFIEYWEGQGRDVSWVQSVYAATSGHIHLSKAHVFSTMKDTDSPDSISLSVSGSIGDVDQYPAAAKPAFAAMIDISNGICAYVEKWTATKELWLQTKNSKIHGAK